MPESNALGIWRLCIVCLTRIAAHRNAEEEPTEAAPVKTERHCVVNSGYSPWGGSAGARMAAWLGTYGAEASGGGDLPRPGAVVMQYTGLNEYSELDPPTYACVGDRDGIANWRVMQTRLDAMQRLGIDTEFHVYPGLGHGFGLGTGTSAEGWLNDAAAFWEKQM